VTPVTDKHMRQTQCQWPVSNTCVIRLHCPEPQCWTLGTQNCTFDLLQLTEALFKGEDIKVIAWNMPPHVESI